MARDDTDADTRGQSSPYVPPTNHADDTKRDWYQLR